MLNQKGFNDTHPFCSLWSDEAIKLFGEALSFAALWLYNNLMEPERKSRSQIKRETQALQKLGERLVELSPEQLETIDMPDTLREAVLFAQRITSREARRRQLQYIGTVMRRTNPETIRQAFENRDHQSRETTQALHQLEQWREGLIQGHETLIDYLCQRFPHTDRQRLRQLVRNARKEQSQEKPPKAARQLFRYLREISSENHTQ